MPLVPNTNGGLKLGWTVMLARRTMCEVCDYFSPFIAKVRVERQVYLLTIVQPRLPLRMKCHGHRPGPRFLSALATARAVKRDSQSTGQQQMPDGSQPD